MFGIGARASGVPALCAVEITKAGDGEKGRFRGSFYGYGVEGPGPGKTTEAVEAE